MLASGVLGYKLMEVWWVNRLEEKVELYRNAYENYDPRYRGKNRLKMQNPFGERETAHHNVVLKRKITLNRRVTQFW